MGGYSLVCSARLYRPHSNLKFLLASFVPAFTKPRLGVAATEFPNNVAHKRLGIPE
jgi:hypothetical protein